jgi:peptide/nickel transport system substrate-binding protein
MSDSRQHPHIPKLQEALAEGRIGRREFLRTATLLGLSAGAAYGFVGRVTGQGFSGGFVAPARAAVPKGGSIKIGMPVLEVVHPHAHNWLQPANITLQTCETLTRTHQDNITRPLLLESWEASDDLKTWNLKLRQDVKWHSGRPLLADDVVWNLKYVLDPANGSSSLGLMKSYMLEEFDSGEKNEDGSAKMSTRLWDANAIEKIDDHTVRLNLQLPQVAIPEHLFHYTSAITDPEENGEYKVGSNGTGPFTLVDHQVGVQAVLEAKQGYYRDGPYLDRVNYIDLGEDPSALVGALASKQVDLIFSADISLLDTMKAIPHLEIHQAHTANTAVVQMMTTQKPYDDPKVRQALRYGMDSNECVNLALRGFGLAGEHHFVCPVHPDYAPLPEMTRDPAKAKQLLAEAGYPDGIDIEFNCKKDPAWELAAVQAMTEQWKEAGIRANINVMPSAQFWDVWDKFPMGFVAWAHRPLGFMVLSLGFRGGVPWNPTGFADKEFDELLNQAEATLDIEERKTIMAELEKIMQERGPIAQPIWEDTVTAATKSVRGFTMHPAKFFFCEELGIEA